jgi:hypothetical protein
VTANSQDQLRDVTWSELLAWGRKLPPQMHQQYEWGLERIFLKAEPESCFAAARTASRERPEALQGFHSENSLIVVEEASGLEDDLFIPMIGALSTAGSKMVMASNPTRLSGYFYDSHHRLRSSYWTARVSSEDVDRAKGHIEDIIARFGKDSNAYRVRVLGEFPTVEDQQVISLELCLAAVKRDVQPIASYRVVWGVDVARFGDDRTALAKRRGNVQMERVKFWRGKDSMQVTGLLKLEYDETEPEDRPSEILVDVLAMGAGVVDRCRELGLPVRGVNVGETAAVEELYSRQRDELWFKARRWLEERDSKLLNDDELISELTLPTYNFMSSGKVVVETKSDMKKRASAGYRSPDLADAWCLTFAGGLDKIEPAESDRYQRRKRFHARSWMSA